MQENPKSKSLKAGLERVKLVNILGKRTFDGMQMYGTSPNQKWMVAFGRKLKE